MDNGTASSTLPLGTATVASLAKQVLRAALPYPDPWRRRDVRAAARRLITCAPWPGDDATALDVAQLALLRMLWLQRETHRAARARHTEATVLLARAALELCIAGLYWLQVGADVAVMRRNNAEALRRLLHFLGDDDPIMRGLISAVTTEIGPPEQLPDLRSMADTVAATTGRRFTKDLYHRFYVPLSTYYPHVSGSALLRHVKSSGQLDDEPARVLSRRSALHLADAGMAVLAAAVAERGGAEEASFVEYANAHWCRAIPPVGTLATRSMFRGMRWRKLPDVYQSLVALRRYRTDGAACDDYSIRRARMRRGFADALELVDLDIEQRVRDIILDHVADELAKMPDDASAD